jgi:hypothetical protein
MPNRHRPRASRPSDGRDEELFERLLDGTLPKEHIGAACDKINDELLMRGIDSQHEPSKYGIELEELLDTVNRGRLS